MKHGVKKHWLLLIIPFGIMLDQLTKYVAELKLSLSGPISIIEGFFSFNLAYNTGAAWGLFSGQKWFLIGMPLLIIIAGFIYYFKSKKFYFNLGLLVVITGALGNLIDRVLTGRVVDFLDFIVFGYDFPVFNLADICITLGSIFLAIYLTFEKEEIKNEG